MRNLNRALEELQARPECIDAYQDSISDYLYDQINDYDVFMVTAVFQRDGDERVASLIINNEFMDRLDWSQNPAQQLIDDLIFCECAACTDDGVGSITDIYSNNGSPIFYISPTDGRGIRLKERIPNAVVVTADLQKLIDELKAVPGILEVELEEIIDPVLMIEAGSEAIFVRCTTNTPPHYSATFVITPLVWLDDTLRSEQVAKVQARSTSI